MGKVVNRRDRDYHTVRLSEMTELDKIASTLLALSYSSKASPTKKSQGLIQMDCVAVCIVTCKGVRELWVASNKNRVDLNDINNLAKEIPAIDIYIVDNGHGDMHAEMKLLSELLQNQDCRLEEPIFGVSKPCCKKCSGALTSYKIEFTHSHSSSVKTWETPWIEQVEWEAPH